MSDSGEGAANRVHELSDGIRIAGWTGETEVRDAAGGRWQVTEDGLVSATDPRRRLPRVAAFRASWFGWYAQFPETRLVK